MMFNKSKLDFYSKEELQKLIDESNSIKEVLTKVGLSYKGTGSYVTFYKRVNSLNLKINDLKDRAIKNKKNIFKKEQIPLEKVLVKNSTYNRKSIKERLLKLGILKNVCSICGQLPEWNGKPLTLQLDHINGVSNDNRLENLRIVCPHCHSQTNTFSGRNMKIIKKCIDCGSTISKMSTRCRACAMKIEGRKKVKFDVSKDELEKLIWEEKLPYTKIGEMFGVSDNAIKKRAKKFGIKLRRIHKIKNSI